MCALGGFSYLTWLTLGLSAELAWYCGLLVGALTFVGFFALILTISKGETADS